MKFSQSFLITLLLLFASVHINSQELVGGLINDTSKVVSGGKNSEVSNTYLAWLGVEYEIDDSLRFYADAVLQRGDNGSASTGAIQAYSNIDNDEAFSRLFEVWFEKDLKDLGLRFKVGQLDANSEFAIVEHSDAFLLDAMGFTPTISEMPTYPLPRLSLNAFWQTSDGDQWSIGFYSDNSNEFKDVFTITQWQKRIEDTQITLGAWYKTGGLELPNTALQSRSGKGYYASVSGKLNYTLFDASQAGWFSQFGYTNKNLSAVHTHMSFGLVWYGVHKQTDNLFGAVLSHLRVNQSPLNEDLFYVSQSSLLGEPINLPSNETAIEIFYRYAITPHFFIKPDIQYFIQPANDINVRNALVFTLRTEFAF